MSILSERARSQQHCRSLLRKPSSEKSSHRPRPSLFLLSTIESRNKEARHRRRPFLLLARVNSGGELRFRTARARLGHEPRLSFRRNFPSRGSRLLSDRDPSYRVQAIVCGQSQKLDETS